MCGASSADKQLPAHRFGRARRVYPRDLETYIEAHRYDDTPHAAVRLMA